MDMQFDRNRRREKAYRGVQGTIVSMEPTRIGSRRADGCMMFVGLEDQQGNLVNFMVSPTGLRDAAGGDGSDHVLSHG